MLGASALPLPRTCHLAGGLPLLRMAQEDNVHNENSHVSCSGYGTKGVFIIQKVVFYLWSPKMTSVLEMTFIFK